MNDANRDVLKKSIVDKILGTKIGMPQKKTGEAFAPANIALCKYWGKRDAVLNLPHTHSLSISLNDLGARTRICMRDTKEFLQDRVILNGEEVDKNKPFAKALTSFLDLFRVHKNMYFQVETNVNTPIAAGLASSASGFAALTKALNDLYAWELELDKLSILARLGSGSASRSLWDGFVEWQRGHCREGLDSHGIPLGIKWPELKVGLLIVNAEPKNISSRMAMEKTVNTSPFYKVWPEIVAKDLAILKSAIEERNFKELGNIAEANAQAMHALMMTARPSIIYSTPETLKAQHQIWKLREAGLSLYFTQDAGPNLKLLFLEKDFTDVQNVFPTLKVVTPFENVCEYS